MNDQDTEINEIFDLMDTKRHLVISKRDFKIAIKALGIELPREKYIKLITGIKKNHEGLIQKETFIIEMRKLMSNRNFQDDMVKAFRLIDEDDTGKINFSELKNAALLIGEKISDEDLINMINIADEDGDGEVNLTEFLKLMDKAKNVL